jgi:hypothetical protein
MCVRPSPWPVQELSRCRSSADVPSALKAYESSRLVRSGAVHGLARLASDVLFQSKILFSNAVVGSVVGFFMSLSMPLILEFLYQNVLDEGDWQYAQSRLSDLACYEEVRRLT